MLVVARASMEQKCLVLAHEQGPSCPGFAGDGAVVLCLGQPRAMACHPGLPVQGPARCHVYHEQYSLVALLAPAFAR